MTVQELAKILNMHLGQGRAQYEITMFHCPDVAHGAEPVTALIEREGTQTLEFYSGTGLVSSPYEPLAQEYRGVTYSPASPELRGTPGADEVEMDELI